VRTIRHVAVSVKFSAAIVAALIALSCGVQVAHAGGLGDIVGTTTPTAGQTVATVQQTASDVQGTAGDTVDATVGQASDTAGSALGTVEETVGGTPVPEVVRTVTNTVDPIVSSVGQTVGALTENGVPLSVPSQALPTAPGRPNGVAALAPTLAAAAPTSQHASSLSSPTVASSLQPTGRVAAPISSTHWMRPLLPLTFAPQPNESKASSSAPAAPFAPLSPVEMLATAAALVAGATGAALTAALLGALFLLAPRTGRLARPGPILVGPDPCLSLPERPG
jgi:hypothetical protein